MFLWLNYKNIVTLHKVTALFRIVYYQAAQKAGYCISTFRNQNTDDMNYII